MVELELIKKKGQKGNEWKLSRTSIQSRTKKKFIVQMMMNVKKIEIQDERRGETRKWTKCKKHELWRKKFFN